MTRRRLAPLLFFIAALLLAACRTTPPSTGIDAAAQMQPSPVVSAVYTLPPLALAEIQNAVLPSSIDNDRRILLGSVGSDLWHLPGAPPDRFWMVTDRGPNDQVEVDGDERRTFPVPGFTPLIVEVEANEGALTLLQTIPLRTDAGQGVTGLPNLAAHDEQPYDVSGQNALAPNPDGLDVEGIVRTRSGDFWLSEEYAPSIVHVGADGRVIRRYVPQGSGYVGAGYPVSDALPAIYSQRKENRGFEGISLSPDEETLTVVLQSPLSNPDEETGERSRNTRLLVFDLARQEVVGEYVYRFDPASEYGDDDPDEMKLSAVAALGPTSLLILERTDDVAKLYRVDVRGATNILGSAWDDPATAPSLEALADVEAVGVTPLPKTLVVDLSQFEEMPEKIEGVAVVDADTLAVANDNDFDLGSFDSDGNNSDPPGTTSQVLIVELSEPLR